jgi:hypothetical protein
MGTGIADIQHSAASVPWDGTIIVRCTTPDSLTGEAQRSAPAPVRRDSHPFARHHHPHGPHHHFASWRSHHHGDGPAFFDRSWQGHRGPEMAGPPRGDRSPSERLAQLERSLDRLAREIDELRRSLEH